MCLTAPPSIDDRSQAFSVIPLPSGVTPVEAAATIVNPMTVLGMLDTVAQGSHKAMIHTAAASKLGQMLCRYLSDSGAAGGSLHVIHVVRRPAQKELLLNLGSW